MIVGVVGAGAIGTLFGAALAGAHDVRVLTRDKRSARALAGRGLIVDDDPPQAVSASHDPDVFAGVEIIVIAVKTNVTTTALAPLRDTLEGAPPLVSLQNGIEGVARIEFALGRHSAIALAPTTEGAEALEPGRARRMGRGRTRAGWAAGHANGAVLGAFVHALEAGGLMAQLATPIEPYVWAKLVANAAINPLTALAGVRNGELLARDGLRARAARIALEVAAVARASGIALPFSDPVAFVEDVALVTAANRSSMLVDLEAGRETEIDAITGALVRAAEARGVAVPENRAVLDEVRAREKA